jgi:hypothetical protein
VAGDVDHDDAGVGRHQRGAQPVEVRLAGVEELLRLGLQLDVVGLIRPPSESQPNRPVM